MTNSSPLKLNFVMLLLAQFYAQVLAVVGGIVIVRALGPNEYGRYTLAVTGLNLGAVLSDAGLSAYLGREVARLNVGTGLHLWFGAVQARLSLSALLGLLTVVLAIVWKQLGQPDLVILADLSLLPMTFTILTTAFLNGQGRTKLSSTFNALISSLNLGLLLLALVWQSVAWSVLAANLVTNLIGAWLLTRQLLKSKEWQPQQLQPPLAIVKLLKSSRSFWYIVVASLVFQYADIYLVSLFLGEEATGQYGAALRLLAFMTIIPTVWGIVAVPRFARQPFQTRTELNRWSWGLVISGVGLSLLSLLLIGPLVNLLLGSKYVVTGHVLVWLVWAGAAIFASAGPVTWLTITNQQHLVVIALLGADLLGLFLTLLFVGVFKWGLEGTALARVSTSWALCGLYLLLGRTNSKAVIKYV